MKTKEVLDRPSHATVLIFDDETGEQRDLDFRGTVEEVLSRLEAPVSPEPDVVRGPGRPKLGVIAREVTLLPRHWDWLSTQPGGASVALRKLVARCGNYDKDRVRRSQEAAYRFMSAMAGNLPGFEEATRAFFGGNPVRFGELIEAWPGDIRDHVMQLANDSFARKTDD